MRVIVCGPRDWPEPLIHWLHQQLDKLFLVELMLEDPLIVHGDCPHAYHDLAETRRRWSVDALVQEWAERSGVPTERHPADWKRHGLGAGPIRNSEMAKMGAELCVAFRRHGSNWTHGTADMRSAASGKAIRLRDLQP